MIGHFEEKNENKCLVLDDVDKNKEVSKKYKHVWEGVKKEVEMINGGEKVEYGKDFSKKLGLSLMMTCQWLNPKIYAYGQ